MIYLLPILKDTTIYEKDPYRNAGLDEVLDLSVQQDGNGNIYESRILFEYNISKINEILVNENLVYTDLKVLLVMQPVQMSELPDTFTIEAINLDVDWKNGNGYTMFPSTDNFIFQQNNPPSIYSGVGTVQSSSLSEGATWLQNGDNYFWSSSLYNTVSGGGSWVSGSTSVTQSFNYKENIKFQLDITDLYQHQVSSSINNGIVVKYFDIQNFPATNIQFYSSETNTIYEPKIYLQWQSDTYDTGSLAVISKKDSPVIYSLSNANIFQQNTKQRIYLGARPRYPRPKFTQNSVYSEKQALPSSSFYAIRDLHTNETIIDYSQYTKISCDNIEGNYFDFYATLSPERFYRFVIKVDYPTFTDYYTTNELIFKVIS